MPVTSDSLMAGAAEGCCPRTHTNKHTHTPADLTVHNLYKNIQPLLLLPISLYNFHSIPTCFRKKKCNAVHALGEWDTESTLLK